MFDAIYENGVRHIFEHDGEIFLQFMDGTTVKFTTYKHNIDEKLHIETIQREIARDTLPGGNLNLRAFEKGVEKLKKLVNAYALFDERYAKGEISLPVDLPVKWDELAFFEEFARFINRESDDGKWFYDKAIFPSEGYTALDSERVELILNIPPNKVPELLKMRKKTPGKFSRLVNDKLLPELRKIVEEKDNEELNAIINRKTDTSLTKEKPKGEIKEYAGTVTELAREALDAYNRKEHRFLKAACRSFAQRYTIGGKSINEASLYTIAKDVNRGERQKGNKK